MYCYNTGRITGNSAGGITYEGATYYCYNTGQISGGSVGGIASWLKNSTGNTINVCYNTGYISGSGSAGGINGNTNTSYNSNTVNNSYYLQGSVSGNKIASLGTEATKENLITAVKRLSNFKADIGINDGYPILSWQTNNDKLNLINGEKAFVEDIENINKGYPILAWQVVE